MQPTNQIRNDHCAACDSPIVEDTCPECHSGYCAACLPMNYGTHHHCNVATPKPDTHKVRVVLSALLAGIVIQVDTGYGTVSLRLFQTGETILTPTQEFVLLDAFWLSQVVQVTAQGKPPVTMYVGSHMTFADVLNAASEMSDDQVALLAADIALNQVNRQNHSHRNASEEN